MTGEHTYFLFLHNLSVLYAGEQQIAKMLPSLITQAEPGPARVAFQEHQRETAEQIAALTRCFTLLGEQPQGLHNPVVEGFQQARDTFQQQSASDELLGLYDLVAAAPLEQYEIACYLGLIEQANQMAQPELALLLEGNLRQEEEMAAKVEQLARQMSRVR